MGAFIFTDMLSGDYVVLLVSAYKYKPVSLETIVTANKNTDLGTI